jgi:GNAT superfamily N-acetyltransferase
MTIRPLTLSDLPALEELVPLSEAEGFRFVKRLAEDVGAARVQLDSPCEFFLGCVEEGRLVGVGGITPDPYVSDSSVGRLRHLYVRPEWRRRDVGRALVADLEARAAHCYSRLRLRTDTPVAARFYENLGFEAIESDSATHLRVLPADDIVDLYRRHGRRWAEARGAVPSEGPWIDRFIELLADGATVLDIGAGSGEPIARYLFDRGFHVHGVDSSPVVLELFRANLPEQTAQLADMRSLNLGRTFGGIIAWDSFFHLTPDQQRGMFPIFRAHADEGAPLLFTSGTSAGIAIGSLEGDPLYHASLDPDEYRQLLKTWGFDILDHVAEDPRCGQHTVWLARRS